MKLKFGMIVTDGSGKLGGHVVAKNRGGSYARTKVTPSNPQTVAQAGVRSSFGGFSQSWAGLTEDQRAAWNGAVNDWGTTDIFGDLRNPSGINLYVKLNQNLANIGQASIDSPPLKSGLVSPVLGTLTAGEAGNVLTLAYTGTDADQRLLIEATAPMSPGISNAKNRFRVITDVAGNAASPLNLSAAYVTKFGSLVEDQKLFIRVRPVKTATGQAGPAVVTSAIIAA